MYEGVCFLPSVLALGIINFRNFASLRSKQYIFLWVISSFIIMNEAVLFLIHLMAIYISESNHILNPVFYWVVNLFLTDFFCTFCKLGNSAFCLLWGLWNFFPCTLFTYFLILLLYFLPLHIYVNFVQSCLLILSNGFWVIWLSVTYFRLRRNGSSFIIFSKY